MGARLLCHHVCTPFYIVYFSVFFYNFFFYIIPDKVFDSNTFVAFIIIIIKEKMKTRKRKKKNKKMNKPNEYGDMVENDMIGVKIPLSRSAKPKKLKRCIVSYAN